MELLPQLLFEADGLVLHATRDGDAVVRVQDASGAVLVPERVVALALAILDAWSPECTAAIEREARRARLRLVHGGGPEDAA